MLLWHHSHENGVTTVWGQWSTTMKVLWRREQMSHEESCCRFPGCLRVIKHQKCQLTHCAHHLVSTETPHLPGSACVTWTEPHIRWSCCSTVRQWWQWALSWILIRRLKLCVFPVFLTPTLVSNQPQKPKKESLISSWCRWNTSTWCIPPKTTTIDTWPQPFLNSGCRGKKSDVTWGFFFFMSLKTLVSLST